MSETLAKSERGPAVVTGVVAVEAVAVTPRALISNYPEAFLGRVAGRQKRVLGDLFGLRNFGVNLTRLAPGAASSVHHRHSHQDEFIYVLEGRMAVHTEFYDPVVLEVGQGIYLDSSMGHAYVVAEGCEEALVLGVCSSADDGLMDSLMSLHADGEGGL